MKNNLKKFVFIFTALLCFSITASAQPKDDKKGERKKPPVIIPDKDRKPKDKDKDKKPKPKLVFKFMQARVGD